MTAPAQGSRGGGLDHLIHAVRDLDAGAALYERLGFKVGSENRHPFGTKNRLVQLPGFFVEILTVGDHAPVPKHEPRRFSFAAFQRDRLAADGEGGSGLVLESVDAAADAARFRAAGIGDFEPFSFERQAAAPGGGTRTVGFDLAFAADPTVTSFSPFTCRQKTPENFWNPDAQQHPNGATGVAGVTLTAENPSDHHVFLSAFTGIRDFGASSAGMAFETPRGTIEVLTPAAFAQRFGGTVAGGADMRLSALRFRVADLDATERLIADRGGGAVRRGGRLVVPAEAAFGLTLTFEA